jgi:hypothetical protein
MRFLAIYRYYRSCGSSRRYALRRAYRLLVN